MPIVVGWKDFKKKKEDWRGKGNKPWLIVQVGRQGKPSLRHE